MMRRTADEVVGLAEAMKRVLDALDIETFLVCADAEEAKRLALGIVEEMGLARGDIVFLEMRGPGARVRVRAYVHRPGDRYGWLGGGQG